MERWSHGQVEWNPLLALAIGANVLVQSVTGVYSTALGSLGIARDQGRMMVLQAILNVMVCYLLIRRLGVIGAALGSFITYSLTSAWYIPFRLRLALRTSLRTPGRAGQSA
jgi:Na+-driven multidrug efflux pump